MGKNPKLFLKDGELRFRINHKSFVQWLKEIGLPAGEAKGSAAIPDFIVSCRKLLVRCVRGIYDTDGSVYFDRRPAYPQAISPNRIADDQQSSLRAIRQNPKSNEHQTFLCETWASLSLQTAGLESLGRFLQIIGFSNPYHIGRIGSEYPELVGLNCD